MSDNPTWVGLVGAIIGILIAMNGKNWFPYISATFASLIVIDIVLLFAASKGWTESVHGIEITLFIAIVLAIPVGIFTRKHTGIALGLNGVFMGACAGGLFYCFILAVLGWNTFIGLIMLTCIFAFAGGIMAFEFGWQMVLYGTSFTGSYIFMRSCTLIFSARWAGFPNEHEIYAKLQDGEKVSDEFIAWQFWVYIAVLVIVFFGTAGY